jgi:hypothetical protein
LLGGALLTHQEDTGFIEIRVTSKRLGEPRAWRACDAHRVTQCPHVSDERHGELPFPPEEMLGTRDVYPNRVGRLKSHGRAKAQSRFRDLFQRLVDPCQRQGKHGQALDHGRGLSDGVTRVHAAPPRSTVDGIQPCIGLEHLPLELHQHHGSRHRAADDAGDHSLPILATLRASARRLRRQARRRYRACE